MRLRKSGSDPPAEVYGVKGIEPRLDSVVAGLGGDIDLPSDGKLETHERRCVQAIAEARVISGRRGVDESDAGNGAGRQETPSGCGHDSSR